MTRVFHDAPDVQAHLSAPALSFPQRVIVPPTPVLSLHTTCQATHKLFSGYRLLRVFEMSLTNSLSWSMACSTSMTFWSCAPMGSVQPSRTAPRPFAPGASLRATSASPKVTTCGFRGRLSTHMSAAVTRRFLATMACGIFSRRWRTSPLSKLVGVEGESGVASVGIVSQHQSYAQQHRDRSGESRHPADHVHAVIPPHVMRRDLMRRGLIVA